MKTNKCDIGLLWAHFMATWGQVGVVLSVIQFISTLIILYTVNLAIHNIPIWLFIIAILIPISSFVWFVLRSGISGYYRFLNQQSKLDEINDKLDKLIQLQENKNVTNSNTEFDNWIRNL